MAENRKLTALPVASSVSPDDKFYVVGADGIGRRVSYQVLAAGIADSRISSRLIEGAEYLGAIQNALAENARVNAVLTGDSTIKGDFGVTLPKFVPSTIMNDRSVAMGLTGITYLNHGQNSQDTATWLSTYLATDIASNPTVLVCRWGLNDPRHDLTLTQTEANVRSALKTLRDAYTTDQLSIVLCTPNTASRPTEGVTPAWFAAIQKMYRQIASDFKCCFVDLYGLWPNPDPDMLDDGLLHPNNGFNAEIWAVLGDLIMPKALALPVAPQREANVAQRNYLTASAWRTSAAPPSLVRTGVCWSPRLGIFVAIGSNAIETSPDGITWTSRTPANAQSSRCVCWSEELGLFVVIQQSGTGNRVMTSPDGITWTARTTPADLTWQSVCWAQGLNLFVAVASSGTGNRVMTSPDGINWTSRSSAADLAWAEVCWSRELGLLVAVALTGTGSGIMTSGDGINWTTATCPADLAWRSVCWSKRLRLFVAVAASGTGSQVMTSPNGRNWTLRTTPQDGTWFSVRYAEEIGLFVAVNNGSNVNVMWSVDGITWTAGGGTSLITWRSLCWSEALGLFVAVGPNDPGTTIMTSTSAYSMPYRAT